MEKSKLLLVDDSPENQQLLYQTLKGEYELFSALNGAEALEIAATTIPDLILLDIMMPGMDGYEVCRILKQDKSLNDIPVIFLTALTDDVNEVKGFEVGAVDYITKPFKPTVVRQRVATQLKLKKQQQLLEKKNSELEEALANVKVLSGLLPICLMCKKIRDDKGYWNQLEAYISTHTDAMFSHGYCPECFDKYMQELHSMAK